MSQRSNCLDTMKIHSGKEHNLPVSKKEQESDEETISIAHSDATECMSMSEDEVETAIKTEVAFDPLCDIDPRLVGMPSTSSECAIARPSAAYRARSMGILREVLQPVDHHQNEGPCSLRTPGTSSASLQSNPVAELQPLPTLNSCVEERVEAMDLTDDENEEELRDHISRWMGVQVLSAPKPLAPSTSADVCPSLPGVSTKSKPIARRKVREGSDLDSEFDDEFDVASIESTALSGVGREIPDDEKLDEPVRDIIYSVERAMDEAADRLLGVSNSFTWEEGFESFRGVPEVFSGPTPGPLKDYDTPYDAFTDIWSKDIMELIAQETNSYANQTIGRMKAYKTLKTQSRVKKWTDTDADEIMILFAVFIYMGIDQRSLQNEYWESCGHLTLFNFKELMTYNRYILLNKFLHFVDNFNESQNYQRYEEVTITPKLKKIAPVISHLEKKFSSLYHLERAISIDESLTLFKGRLSWVQVIKSKASRIGIKSYELCESRTGYLYKFQIYTGKNFDNDNVAPSVDLGDKSTKVVLELLKGLENRGHCVTMDNFYNCPALARYLKSLGFDCLGTLRTNRKNVPDDFAKVPKDVPKGTIISRQCGDVSIVAWKDSQLVTMISTYHTDDTYAGSRAGKLLVKPVSVRDYNNTMGGVDLKDQKLSMYLMERKRCMKWYIKMFKRLLNVSIHNAFVMYTTSLRRRHKLPVTHREFRYALAKSISEHHRPVPMQICQPVVKDMRLRKDLVHVPKKESGNTNRKRCVVHQKLGKQKKVHTKCVTCDVFLCFEKCWEKWHSLAKLEGKEVRGRQRRRE